MSSTQLLVALIIFVAMFVQAGAGFGSALIAMPFLVGLLGVNTATPLMALVGIIASIILLFYYRTAFNLRVVYRLCAAAVLGVPLGVLILRHVNSDIVTAFLGIVLIVYALYALIGFTLPQLTRPGWGYVFGFLGGVLGGAYATSGPPVIVYGNCRRWDRDQFKSNLQGFFIVSSAVSIISHVVVGNYTPVVWSLLVVALPAMLIGLAFGTMLDTYINQHRFRQLVQVMLVFLGVSLIL
ncbi:MAG: sulfite exporter TauE/SafE family protein [Anaerolineae bacterium]|nr:sulfite exporter TauE/SafE family protein [Anaerolineae bacterium]MCO5207239.1 sulfite exporter TauE/SafE family protein [Anaerolineae bacterium]